ncbi:hypothetical protein SISSUDRAFT_957387, partial [Sistotremastrum suecicum HHB10207 ss-3]
IPRDIWKKMQLKKAIAEGKQRINQGTLDNVVTKRDTALSFSRERVLHAVAQYVVTKDIPLSHAGSAAFRNALTSMRPHTKSSELPSSHDVSVYINNQYIDLLNEFKEQFQV